MAETSSPDPHAILKMLEAEMNMKRHQRKVRPKSRTAARFGSLLFIVVILIGSLLLLNHLAEVASSSRPPEAVPLSTRDE